MLKDSLTRIGESRAKEFGRGRNPIEAMRAAFEDGGYDPTFESDGEGLKIRITNCPYRRVSSEDRIVCTVDRTMIWSLLGEGVEHQVSIAARSNECVYLWAARGSRRLTRWRLTASLNGGLLN